MSRKITFLVFVVAGLLLAVFSWSRVYGQEPSGADFDRAKAKIEVLVFEQLEQGNQSDFFVWMTEKADLSPASGLATKEEKGQFVFETLRETAERSQADLRAQLERDGLDYRSFYISNKILVRGASESVLMTLAARPDVARITANHLYQLPEPRKNDKTLRTPEAIEPNISFVHADQVWDLGVHGEGVVLAGNDTGLAWDHPAILNQYRGWNGTTADHNYNWWDATGSYPMTPNDGHGHGTHTTGTMVGDDGGGNQIGIAPAAQTIHCKNMDDFGGGDDATFSECFEWDLAPWDLNRENPRPELAPDAINNSWGYFGGNNPVFEDEIAALQAAGIVVEVSAGNEGPGCATLRSPSDYGEVLTTGSVNHQSGAFPGTLTFFSSRGPSALSSEFVPDVMAPGENIRSSLPGGSYEAWSGTSMAGPHVTGLVGLMWSANPGLRGLVSETQQIMKQTAVPLTGQTGSNCGGDYEEGPNDEWGDGTIDALAATEAAMLYGDPGTLMGTVTDSSTGMPISGATIKASLTPELLWKRITDENGQYETLVFSGTYTVDAVQYGYFPQQFSDVQVTSFETTQLDIALEPSPSYLVSGTVTDATTGWPLYASITIDGYPGAPSWSDPVTGDYSVLLAAGLDYTFHVTPWVDGYEMTARSVGPLSGNQSEDIALAAEQLACSAPGYQSTFVYVEDFEGDDGLFTVEDEFTSWEWGVPTSGPNAAHSGNKVWATNVDGMYNNGEFGYVTSPVIDLSPYAGQTVIATWWQWLQVENGFDAAFVEVSPDGGASWYTYYWDTGDVSLTWQKQSIVLDSSFATSEFRIRFGLSSDGSVTYAGFYIDDVGIGVAATPPALLNQDFEADNGSYVAAGSNSSWAWGVPTRGPSGAHSGLNVWATNLDGNYNDNESSTLTSPLYDLSAGAGEPLELSWWQWLQSENSFDQVTLEGSNDGGNTWNPLFGPVSGVVDTEWTLYSLVLDPSYAVNNFQLRFSFESDSAVSYPGLYVDDIVIRPYDDSPPTLPCQVLDGSLIVGNVYDDNTGAAVNGALISHENGRTTLSQETQLDSNVADGFYTLFSPIGSHTLSATKDRYGSDSHTITVPLHNTLAQAFNLPAGQLSANPTLLAATLDMGASTNVAFTLENTGELASSYTIRELDRGLVPAQHLAGAPIERITGEFSAGWQPSPSQISRSPEGSPSFDPPWGDVQPYPHGIFDNTAAAFNDQLYSVGGLDDNYNLLNKGYIYDPASNSWTSMPNMANLRQKPSAAFVRDQLYVVGGWSEFGETLATLEIYDPNSGSWHTGANMPVPVASAPAVALNGQLYIIGGCLDGFCTPTNQVSRYDVDSDTWDTVAAYPTTISWQACGVIDGMIYCAGGIDGYNESNRTYAYDPTTDTWTRLADMLQSQWGSAFTAANGKLYISSGVTNNFSTITNETFAYDPETDSWAAEANANQAVYRGGSACGFYKVGGLSEFGPIAQVELYPELNTCGNTPDVPWISTLPVTGTISAAGNQVINVTLDASVPEISQPGEYLAELRVVDNSPYQLDNVSVMMNVNPPPTWGKIAGTVTGLAHCDAAGTPLHRATVTIAEVTEVKSSSDGTFGYWLPAGTYSLNVSRSGYISQNMTITVNAGQTSNEDIALRLETPCSEMTGDLNVTVAKGQSSETTLIIENSGAGALEYHFLESSSLPTMPSLRAPAAGNFSSEAPIGSLSARSLGVEPQPSPQREFSAVESGWYAGADVPGGAIRYAHAQCAEEHDSFYLFSGVDNRGQISPSSWRYDAIDNSWQPLAAVPQGQEGPTATCYQGRIYLMGGGGTNQFYIYDIVSDTWFAGAALPRSVWGAAAGAWDGKLYLIGGDSDFYPGGTSLEVNIYDIATDSWSSNGSAMPQAALTPGFVQMGQYVYVVGGWNDNSPESNVNVSQRYDMSSDSWEEGPEFSSARADFALAATNQALYAIGGDETGGFFFDSSDTVERLTLTEWPAGSWSDINSPLPLATSANNAGYCTTGFFPAQVWSVGGLSNFNITGTNRFLGLAEESCFSPYEDLPWLSQTPSTGNVPADSSSIVTLTFDATGLALGSHEGLLVAISNDTGQPQYHLPVTLTVTQPTAITLSSWAAHQAPTSRLVLLLIGMMWAAMAILIRARLKAKA